MQLLLVLCMLWLFLDVDFVSPIMRNKYKIKRKWDILINIAFDWRYVCLEVFFLDGEDRNKSNDPHNINK